MSDTTATGSLPVIRFIFWLGAIYPAVLAAAALFFAPAALNWASLSPPHHLAYVRVLGALVLIFAIMMVDMATNPRRYRNLIAYAALLQIAICALGFYYWSRGPIAQPLQILVVVALVLLVLLLVSYVGTRPRAAAGIAAQAGCCGSEKA